MLGNGPVTTDVIIRNVGVALANKETFEYYDDPGDHRDQGPKPVSREEYQAISPRVICICQLVTGFSHSCLSKSKGIGGAENKVLGRQLGRWREADRKS